MSKFPCQWLVCAISSQLLLFFLHAHCFFFFLSLYSYCYPNELLPFFLFLFFPLAHCYFLSCYFFSYLSTVTFFPVTFFPVTFFPTWNCYFLSCYLFSCYFLSVHWLAGVVEKAVNRSDLESKYIVLCVLFIQSSILEDFKVMWCRNHLHEDNHPLKIRCGYLARQIPP